MIGAGVTDMIAEAVVARKLETGHEILKSIHPHPTMSEAVMEAVADAYAKLYIYRFQLWLLGHSSGSVTFLIY
jgi:hypothetical protein